MAHPCSPHFFFWGMWAQQSQHTAQLKRLGSCSGCPPEAVVDTRCVL